MYTRDISTLSSFTAASYERSPISSFESLSHRCPNLLRCSLKDAYPSANVAHFKSLGKSQTVSYAGHLQPERFLTVYYPTFISGSLSSASPVYVAIGRTTRRNTNLLVASISGKAEQFRCTRNTPEDARQ